MLRYLRVDVLVAGAVAPGWSGGAVQVGLIGTGRPSGSDEMPGCQHIEFVLPGAVPMMFCGQTKEAARSLGLYKLQVLCCISPMFDLSEAAKFVNISSISHIKIWTDMSLHARGQREAASPHFWR